MTRSPQRGSAPLFLLATIVIAITTGVVVYVYLKDHYKAQHADEVATARTQPARPTPPPPPPIEEAAPVPVPEPPAPEPTVAPPDDPAPNELTTEQIETTLAGARARFADCGVVGSVKLTLKIRPSGRVEQVTIEGSDSDETRACLVTAAKRVKFAKSANGLTTKYVLAGE